MVVSLPEPACVLMVGPSGCGKSTVAAWLASQHDGLAVLSYDQAQDDGGVCTQDAVDQVHAELTVRCATGLSSIVDGTHRQPARRRSAIAIADAHGLPVVAVVLRVPVPPTEVEVCVANQRRRSRRIPEAHVREHHAVLTAAMPDLLDEGYETVVVLTESAVARLLD